MPSTHVNDILKSLEEQEIQEKQAQAARDPESVFIDPFNILNFTGPKSKPGPISYSILRYMASVPAIAAVINTRQNQMANFTRRPKNDKDTGFRVTTADPEAEMTPELKALARKYEDFFLTTGWVPNKKRKDNLNKLMRKLTRDTLSLDEIAIEIVPGRNVMRYPVSEVYAIDPATIEIVLPAEEELAVVYEPVTPHGMKQGGKNIAYVQRVAGQVKTEYTEDELIRAHRNPRTDLDYSFFGYSELEQLITIVTAIVNALHYNTSYFSQSNLPQGVLEIVGKYKPEHLEGFKRAWTTLVSGSVGRQWKVPVMALEEGQGFKFTPFKQGNREMEYSQFMEFLFNLACAVYQIDPREVGFKSWDSSGSKTMDNDAPASQIENSKDKGFYPLMQFFADTFNSEIMARIDPRFRFEWVGLDEDRAKEEWAMEKEQLEAGVMTLRMYWEKHDVDYSRYKNEPWIDAPANQVLVGLVQQAQQAQQQMDMQDQQHQSTMEQKFVDGVQQGALQNAQAKNQQQMQDQQHQNQMEQQFHQGVQQSALQSANNQAQMQMKQGDQQHQMAMQDAAHQNTLEHTAVQGVQQAGLQASNLKNQADMKQADRDHQMQMQDAQHGNQLEHLLMQALQQVQMQDKNNQAQASMKQADRDHQMKMQDNQQQGSLNQLALQGVQQAQGARLQADLGERSAQANHERQKENTRLSHVLTLRQKFADTNHAKGMESHKAKLAQDKERETTKKSRPDSLQKSIETEGVLEIIVELV